ncbi:MAG: sulfotransferase [bacterium]
MPADSTINQLKFPPLHRLINRAGKTLDRLGISLINLSAESLLKAACRQTGLSDWGDEDFLTPLTILLDSYNQEADLSFLGRISVRQNCIRLLSNRLRIQDDCNRYPQILETPICRPLFIVGLPRTGTTLLHNLLAQDPTVRVPRTWELMQPSPPPTPEGRKTDRRIAAASKKINRIFACAPQIFSIHPFDPTGPEECILLFQHGFTSYLFVLYTNVPHYTEWLLQHDMVPAYQYYRRQLQLLQWRCPGSHWVLKSPAHLFSLNALLTVFPDACLVQTHRDPHKVVPSLCSLSAMAISLSSNRLDLKCLGERGLSLCGTAIDRAMQVRESASPGQFYDVHYRDLVTDPIGVVRQIYTHFSYDFDPCMEKGMRQWLAANPQFKHGSHRYSLDQFSLDRQAIASRFAAYREKFNVGQE